MRLTNVHRVLLFDQMPWLKNYINFDTHQRTSAAAKNDFERGFFKLMNNAVFCKSFVCLFVFYTDSFTAGKAFLLCLFVHMYS